MKNYRKCTVFFKETTIQNPSYLRRSPFFNFWEIISMMMISSSSVKVKTYLKAKTMSKDLKKCIQSGKINNKTFEILTSSLTFGLKKSQIYSFIFNFTMTSKSKMKTYQYKSQLHIFLPKVQNLEERFCKRNHH